MSLFQTNDYIQLKCFKFLNGDGKKSSKLKIQKQAEGNLTENIRNLFKPKKINNAIKDLRIIKILRLHLNS